MVPQIPLLLLFLVIFGGLKRTIIILRSVLCFEINDKRSKMKNQTLTTTIAEQLR